MSQQPANIGLTQEQEDSVWEMYEKCGSMAEVARVMEVGYHHVRAALVRDPIRLMDIKSARSEQVATRWEKREQLAAIVTSRLTEHVVRLLDHIEDCAARSALTELVDPRFPNVKLDSTQALQWLLGTKQLDSAAKLGLIAAKIVQDTRESSFGDVTAKLNGPSGSKDPSVMTDDELHQMVQDLESAGRPLPWGVQQWRDAQEAKRLRAGGR